MCCVCVACAALRGCFALRVALRVALRCVLRCVALRVALRCVFDR